MTRPLKDELHRFIDHGVDLARRRIYAGSISIHPEHGESGVDSDLAGHIITSLDVMESESEMPITILLNNPGGDIYHGLAIYDAIKACKSFVTVIGYGYVMSASAWLMQAADSRILAPNASMLVHYGETGLSGHAKDVERGAKEATRLHGVMEQHLLGRMKEKKRGLKISHLRSRIKNDWYLTAEEAVEWGLADTIL